MARALYTDGTEPSKEPRVIHACNMCDADLAEIRLPTLSFWEPGFKYVRKYPLSYGTFLCESHKREMGFGAHGYYAVPHTEGQDMISALRDYLNLLEEAEKGL